MAPETRTGLSAECDEDCADDCRFGQPEEASEDTDMEEEEEEEEVDDDGYPLAAPATTTTGSGAACPGPATRTSKYQKQGATHKMIALEASRVAHTGAHNKARAMMDDAAADTIMPSTSRAVNDRLNAGVSEMVALTYTLGGFKLTAALVDRYNNHPAIRVLKEYNQRAPQSAQHYLSESFHPAPSCLSCSSL